MTTEQVTAECVGQAKIVASAANLVTAAVDHQKAQSAVLAEEDKKLNEMVCHAIDNGLMKVGGAYLAANGMVIGIICRDERGAQTVMLTLNK